MYNETPQQAAQRLAAAQIRQGFKFIALHGYEDADAKPVYWRIRLKHPIRGEKWIRPFYQNDKGRFVLGEPSFPAGKPLYYLSPILRHPDAVVWITEGEACADHLVQLGLLATTSGSADSASKANWSVLAKRSVVIWPDQDEAGLQYAKHVTQQLHALGCPIQWVDIEKLSLPDKGDCVDWLHQHPHATGDDIEALPRIRPCTALNQDIPPCTVMHQEKKRILSHTSQNISQTNTATHQEAHPCFVVKSDGVYYQDEDTLRWVCSKLLIKALVRDHQSENWGRLLALYDADGKTHTWAMPMEMLKGSGEELRGELLRLGLEIAPGMKARNLLVEYIITAKTQARARCVTRTGWHPPVFVLPEQTLGQTTEIILHQSINPVQDYRQAGSLADWQQQVAARCVGNSRLVLAISCAFAALLLHPLGAESGGLHFVGESSTGKTTALRVAASVYGAPDYLHRWRATSNGLEGLAALRCDTLLVLDELAQADAKEAGEIAYMLANGSGKARASKNGALRSCAQWRLLFLSAGEVGLTHYLEEAGKKAKAGQTVRLVDIPADAGKGWGIFENLHTLESPAAFSKTLTEATATYYGVAALAFLQSMIKEGTPMTHALRESCQSFIQHHVPSNASGQVYRVCERFALIAAAGESAIRFGITPWSPGEAHHAAQRCFQDWLAQRGSLDNQERISLLSHVRKFFEMHGEARFTDWYGQNSRTINRAGFKKSDPDHDSTLYYVLPGVFRQEICAGFDYRNVTQTLLSASWLQPGTHNTAYRREQLPGIGRVRCYVFTPHLWES